MCFVRYITLYVMLNTHSCSNCSRCQYFFSPGLPGHQVVCQNVEQYFFLSFLCFIDQRVLLSNNLSLFQSYSRPAFHSVRLVTDFPDY